MTFQVALLIFGILLLLLGLVGKIKAKELEAGTTNPAARTVFSILGLILVVVSFDPGMVTSILPGKNNSGLSWDWWTPQIQRQAHEQAEAERQAREQAEAERQAREQAEAERQAREQAEAERQAHEQAEAERHARVSCISAKTCFQAAMQADRHGEANLAARLAKKAVRLERHERILSFQEVADMCKLIPPQDRPNGCNLPMVKPLI
jgi:hypothetical protein